MELWAFLKEKMMNYPKQEIRENDAVLTYEEMIIIAESLEKKLRGQTCCGIYCKSELFASIALLGCFAAGVTAVPLSGRYGSKHCNKILQDVKPSCVITDVEGKFGIYDILDSDYHAPEQDISLIMYTSGTSGRPKGAMLSTENIITNICDITDYFSIGNHDTILISRPLYHCAVLTGEFLVSLIRGVKIVFFSESFHPVGLLKTIDLYKVSVFCGTPTMLETVCYFNRKPKQNTVKKVVVSGECLNRATAQKIRAGFPNAEIYHVYGLTEACPRVCFLPPELFDEHPDCVGMTLKSVMIKITNDNGVPVPKTHTGVLWVHGKNVMVGYYNAPDLSAKVLKDGWLCTGDLACITDCGLIKIKGRKDDLIIRAGMNIYPQEIESELKKDPRTKEVFAYGYNDKGRGTQIGLKIAGDFNEINDVRKLCAELLPPYQFPIRIEIVESLPKNGMGKILRVKKND